jgi:hypothetical protein
MFSHNTTLGFICYLPEEITCPMTVSVSVCVCCICTNPMPSFKSIEIFRCSLIAFFQVCQWKAFSRVVFYLIVWDKNLEFKNQSERNWEVMYFWLNNKWIQCEMFAEVSRISVGWSWKILVSLWVLESWSFRFLASLTVVFKHTNRIKVIFH